MFSLMHMRTSRSQTTKLLDLLYSSSLLEMILPFIKYAVSLELCAETCLPPWEKFSPRGTFFKIKLGLHLSPVCDHDHHVLAAVADSVFTPLLIRECLGLAVRLVVYTSASSLVRSISKGQVDYLEAGKLHLAREGVLYLVDLSSHKQSARDQQWKLDEGPVLL